MVQKYLLYVKSTGSRVRGRECRHTPCKVHKMEHIAETVNDYFRKKLHLCLKYVWNWKGSQCTSAPLENTIFQAKRKVAYTNFFTKMSAMKVVFREGADRIWKLQKSFRHKMSHFQYWADVFQKKCLRSVCSNFRYSVEWQTRFKCFSERQA